VRFLTEGKSGRRAGRKDSNRDDNEVEDELNDWDDDDSWDDQDDYDESMEVDPVEDEEDKEERVVFRAKKEIRGVDAYLDTLLSRATGTGERSKEKLEEYAPKIKRGAKKVARSTKRKIEFVEQLGDSYSRKVFTRSIFDSLINFIIAKPKLIIISVLLLTAAVSVWGIIGIPPEFKDGEVNVKLQENIRGDFEVYLPQEHETKKVLDMIQEDWSTDIIVIVVETSNANPIESPEHNNKNITDIDVLKEISRYEERFNEFREDNRGDDGIYYMLSIATLIKEINSTPPRIKKALEEEFAILGDIDLDVIEGGYSIPNDEQRIKAIFEQLPPESRNKIITDSNNDYIYDTGIILIGITQDVDQEQLVTDMREATNDLEYCNMTLTGPIPMTQAITKRTYSEFMKTLPAAILLVAGVLMLFHRTPKIVIITGVPVLCSLAITFGILGGTNMTLTPQVVLIAPILIALGVAYGLYIANRYSDESQIEDKEERIRVAVRTTGKAIFLSALTTAIGFASLLTVQMIPLQVLGFGLSAGIMICYTVTMLTVPSFVMALDYQKKGEIKVKEKLGNVPVNHRKKIIGLAVIFVIISVILIPQVQANMDFVKMAPQDEPVIIKMREYSDKFGGGQQGMILVKGRPAPMGQDQVLGSMRDAIILADIDLLSQEINEVENTKALSIIDIMKSIKPPGDYIEPVEDFIQNSIGREIDLNMSFWDLIQTAPTQRIPIIGKSVQQLIIDVFYNSLSIEMRGMFVNEDYSRTLFLIDMPTMDVVNTKKAVNEVNEITKDPMWNFKVEPLTGFGAILVAVNDLLIESALQSTIIALILVLIVLAIIFRSIKFSAITLIPVCMVVILQPVTLIGIGGLGGLITPGDPYFSGELNLFTAILGSIIVGIGIDFGIHMTERIRERGMNLEGVRYGVSTSGIAFVEATFTMIAGLAAVFLVEIPAIQEFILLVMILLVYSVIGALFILTAIYTVMIRSRAAREQKNIRNGKLGAMSGSISDDPVDKAKVTFKIAEK
jgi:predicted RND superfamily exporter protein